MAEAIQQIDKWLADLNNTAKASKVNLDAVAAGLTAAMEKAGRGTIGFEYLAKSMQLLNVVSGSGNKEIEKLVKSRVFENVYIAKTANLNMQDNEVRKLAIPITEKLLSVQQYATKAQISQAADLAASWAKQAQLFEGVKGKEESYRNAISESNKYLEQETALKTKNAIQQGNTGTYMSMMWKEKFAEIGAKTKAAADAMVPGLGGLIGKVAGLGPALGIAGVAFGVVDTIIKGMSKTFEAMPFMRFIGMSGDPNAAIQARSAFLTETANLFMSNQDAMSLMEITYSNYALTSIPLTDRLTMSNTELDAALQAVNLTAAKNIVHLTNIGKTAGLSTAQSVNVAATIMNKMNVSASDVDKTFMKLISRSQMLQMPVETLVDMYGKMTDKLRFANVGFEEMDPYIINLIGSFQSLASGTDKFWKDLGTKPEMASTLIKDYFDIVQKVPAMTYMAFAPLQNRLSPGKMFLEALETSPFKRAMAVYGGFMDSQTRSGKDMKEAMGGTIMAFSELQAVGAEAPKFLELLDTARKRFSGEELTGKSDAQIMAMVIAKTGRPEEYAAVGATMRRMEEGPMAATNMLLERIMNAVLSIATSAIFFGGAGRMEKLEMQQQLAGFGNAASTPAMLRMR